MNEAVKAHWFTASNASEMAKRGAFVKEALRQKRINGEPQEPEAVSQEKFRLKRLLCVRAQLVAVDKAIQDEVKRKDVDAAKLDRLASAAARLNEQERQLSNRSLPPTLKANAVSTRKRSSPVSDPEPE